MTLLTTRCDFTRDGVQCVVSAGHEHGHLLDDGSAPIPVSPPVETDWDKVRNLIQQELEIAANGEGYEPRCVADAIVNIARYGNEYGPNSPAPESTR